MRSKFRILIAYVLGVSLLLSQPVPGFTSDGSPPAAKAYDEATPLHSVEPDLTPTAAPTAAGAVYTEIQSAASSPAPIATPSGLPAVTATPTARGAFYTADGEAAAVQATPSDGPEVTSEPVSVVQSVYDTEPPSVPADFKCVARTDTTVSLSWGASADNSGSIAGYDIYEGESLLIPDVKDESYNLSGLSPGVTYSFTVRARDEAGNLSGSSTTLTVTTLTIISSYTALLEDKSIGDLYINSGALDLNGHKLTVNGRLIQVSGTLNINGGQLYITGDYRLQRENIASNGSVSYSYGTSYLKMTNSADYVWVGGNFTTQSYYSHNGYLTAGILEVKGNFTQSYYSYTDNFKATGTHRVVLSGEALQTVSFQNAESGFATLELKNYSGDGIKFTSALNASAFIDNGCKAVFPNGEITGWKLSRDETCEGDLYLGAGTLDLNGYKLTVNGSLIQSGGTVLLNGGRLEISGDYRLQTASKGSGGNVTYGYGNAYLKMTDDADYVKVGGNFATQSQYGHNGYLTAGTLEVKGDFTQKSYNTNDNFRTGGTHRVLLSGDALQTVSFEYSYSGNSCFNILEITNTSGQGVRFASKAVVIKELKATTTPLTGSGYITLGPAAAIGWDSWGYDLGFEENRTLQRDLVIGGSLYISGGTFDLNGHKLTVNGSLIHGSGTLNINGGQLYIKGDYRLQRKNVASNGSVSYSYGTSYLRMTNSADYVEVEGNFTTQSYYSHNGYLTAGILEVKGNFTQSYYSYTDNFKATGTHRVVLSGEALQTVSFQNAESGFATLELKNYSGDGIKFTSALNASAFIDNGCKAVFPNGEITGWKLSRDETCEGDLYLGAGTLDLNGYKLTVNGSLIQSGGTVLLNGGRLEISGDYRLQTASKGSGGNVTYGYGNAYLKMTDDADYVKVGGNFATQSQYGHNGYLTAGTLEVKGDFTQKSYNTNDNFRTGGTHRVLLSGDALQTVSFEYSYSGNSCFNILEITNTSGQGVRFASKAVVIKELKATTTPLTGSGYITLGPAAAIGWDSWGYDLGFEENRTLQRDLVIGGSLYISGGTFDLNGHKLTVNGSLIHGSGTLNINGGQLYIKGDYRLQRKNVASNGSVSYSYGTSYLRMTNSADYVEVEGNFTTQSYYSHNGYLTAGVLEIKGNFTQNYYNYTDNFKATGTHRVILSGEALQTVSFQNAESGFATLELKNYSGDGVKFTSALNAMTFIGNGCKAVFPNGEITGWKLSHDETYEGDLYLGAGTLDLNGYKLTVNGSLIQPGGTVFLNGGQLEISGDYRLQTASKGSGGEITYGYSNVYLKMTNDADYVKVGGNFATQSQYGHNGYLTAGTLEVKGDFTQKSYNTNDNFRTGGTHRVLLSGDALQTVSFEYSYSGNSCFNILEITNTSGQGVRFASKAVVIKELKATTTPLTGSGYITLGPAAAIGWDSWGYDLGFEENRTLQRDLVIGGSLYISGGTFDLNGHKLTVNGSLIHGSGTLNINGGQLYIKGDYRLQRKNVASNGSVSYSYGTSYLRMTNSADYVEVEGNFTTQSYYSHNGYLTAGVLEVKGNFTQSYYNYTDNFKATGTHRVILSGEALQTVSFQNAESGFATLELKNYSGDGIKFTSALNAAAFISNGCKAVFPNGEITGWKLSRDETYEGDLYLSADVLDLNGHTLTVKGSFIQPGGTVFLNGGRLEISGDYRLQTAAKGSGGEITYGYSNGYLKMTNDADYVKVGGNFATQSQYGHNGYLTAGTLEVKGDFTQKSYNTNDNFRTGGTHRVLLSGDALQTVSFEYSYSGNSCFNILEITNTSGQGVRFASKAVVIKELKATTTPLTGSGYITLGPAAAIGWDSWGYDLGFEENRTLQRDLVIGGSLYISGGSFDLSGHSLTVGRSLIQGAGTLNINGGQLYIKGDYRLQRENKASDGSISYSYGTSYLRMTNSADYVEVGGNFTTQSYYSHNGYLTAGILEVKGNFTQSYYNYPDNFKATGTHKVILSGAALQTVSFQNTESLFNILSITKPLNSGYSFNRTPVWNTLIEEPRDDQAPEAPANLSLLSKTASTVILSWTASADNVGVTGYDIYRDGIRVGSSASTGYTDTGLEPERTYSYYVEAYDIVRNRSERSNSLDVTTEPDTQAPTAPKNLVVATKSPSSISLSWTGSSDNVKVAGYEICRNGAKIAVADGTSHTDSGLAPGTYTYTVRAFDSSGNFSEASNQVAFDNQAPTAPELMVSSKTAASVSLRWTASADNVGVTGYELYRNGVKIKTLTATSYNDTGLTPDTAYTYIVKAYDAAGNISDESNALQVDTVIDTQPPTVPANLRAASKTGKSVTLEWNASTDNVSVSGYEIYRDGIKIGDSTSLRYTDTGLSANITYSYAVKAYDAAGNRSDICPQISVVPLIPRITNIEPSDGVTIGGSGYRISVYFANSSNYEGSHAAFEYSIDGITWININSRVYGPNWNSSEVSFYCNWDLTDIEGGSYWVRYTVYDAANDSDTMTALYQVDRSAPSAPGKLTATSGAGITSLIWEPSPEADTSLYRVYRGASAEGEFIQIGQTNGRTSVTYTDNTTAAGQIYYYRVSAVDKYGQESAWSEAVGIIAIKDDIPPVVIGIEPVEGTKVGTAASILVRAEDNLLLSSVRLQYSLNGTDNWTDIETINTTGNATFDWNLPPVNGRIFVRAIARDMAGNESDGSPVRTYVSDQQGPEQVTGLTAAATATSVTLRWNDVPDNDFAYFQVERKDAENGTFQNIGKIETTLGMNVTGLAPDTTYWFRVAAYDRLGNRGQASPEVQAVTASDTQAPVIAALDPKPGRFSSAVTIRGTAADNVGVVTFTFQTSTDRNTWTDVMSFTPSQAQTSVTYTHTIDLTGADEGPLFVRAIARDAAGNTSDASASAPFVEYMVDHTAPAKPSSFYVSAATGYITLGWSQGSETDLSYYRLYRATAEDGMYSLIADKLSYVSYNDRDISHGNTYFYKLTAVDSAGNESEAAGALSGQLTPDTEAPEIVSFYPSVSAVLPANPVISVLASDNYKLSRVWAEYKEENAAEWAALGSKDLNVYSDAIALTWNTSSLASGNYQVRAMAQDQAGNISEAVSATYTLNLDAPAVPTVTAVPGGWRVDLSWTSGNEPDLAGFRVYRSTAPGGSYKLLAETVSTTYSDTPLAPGQNYYYKVEAVDKYRNASMSAEIAAAPLNQDPFAPTVEAGVDMIAAIGMEIAFDGTLSKDNDRIASYFWNFGDGATSSIAQPNHAYRAAGTYTVTLTVTDPTGNTASDTATITVYPEQQVGTLEVRVIDGATGAAIPGASVYVDFPGDTLRLFTADAKGIVAVVSMAGNYNVSAYKTGYLPAEVNAKVEQYKKTQTTVKIQKGELVVGEMYVRRMALEEIVAAGIDIHAPENQFVYNFEVHLEFNQQPLPVQYMVINGHGTVFSGGGGFAIGGGSGGGDGGKSIPKVISHPEHPEVPPTIAYLVIPKYASWLKEFFEVGLVLKNMADPQFVIRDSSVTLKLPEGLSLAPTAEKQSLTVGIGELAGQETKEVKWIIRGDTKGYYDLEADFSGTLMPFAAAVNANFKTEEPFRVWGGDALHIYVMAEEAAYIGESYYTHFMLVNESDIPIYNIKTDFGSYQEPVPKTETVVIHPDGTKQVIHSDGTETIDYKDGTRENVNADGSKYITLTDGSKETVATDGARTVTKPDGDTETILPDADKTKIDEDGSKEYFYSDGSSQYIRARTDEDASMSFSVSGSGEAGEQEENMPVVYPGDSLGVACLMPGEVILGTYVTTFSAEGDPDEVYYVLKKAFSTALGGSNTEIPVTISTIPSHMYKYKLVIIDQSSMWADPVDTNTGAHVIEREALGVMGTAPLTFDIDYNSRLVNEAAKIKESNNGKGIEPLSQIGNGTMGNGWSNNYETWLTENKDGTITVYWSPYNYSIFYKESGGAQRTVYGTTDKYGNITITGAAAGGAAEYRAKTQGMKDYVLKRSEDGSYSLVCANQNKYFFNKNGGLIKLEDKNGRFIDILRTEDKKLIITEPVSGQKLIVEYDAQGMVSSVADRTGRKTVFSYDADKNLTKIIDPDNKATTYTYDSKGYVLTGTDAEGVTYFKNTYDGQGRVLTQDDGVDGNKLTTFSYDETSEFWRTITTITDRNGKTRKNIHDRMGQLVKTVDELGNITTYTYDADGNRTSMTDPKGYTTLYTYDSGGNLLTITDAEGTATAMTYDGNGNLLTVTNANGEKAVNTYTVKNLLESTTDQRGNKTTYKYDDNGQILTKTVSGLGTVKYTYQNGLMETATDYEGNSFSNEYDGIGRLAAAVDREGSRKEYTYDAVVNILTETDSSGNKVSFTYDSHGNVLTEKDERGNTTHFKYNGNGKLIEVTDPKGNRTAYEYDGEDRQVKVTDPQGNEAVTQYDGAGRIVSAIDALGNETSFEYDSNGLLLSETAPGKGKTTYTYYKNGKVKTATDTAGNTTTYHYDLLWRVGKITDAKGNSTSFTYDEAGNILTETDPLGNMLSYTYDSRGNLASGTDARGNTTQYSYNSNGNLSGVIDALGNKTEYLYDREDRLLKIIDARGNEKTMAYDRAGRIKSVSDELGNTAAMEYDAAGNLIKLKDAYGREIQKTTYDSMNLPTVAEDALGNKVANSYDTLGRLVETVDALNRSTKYSYDKMNRVVSVIDPLNGESKQAFDADGNLKTLTDPNGNGSVFNYDAAGRLVSETTAIGSVKIYGYNSLNLLSSMKNGRGQETSYIYDAAGRLSSFSDPAGTVTYTYDANGNVLTVSDSTGTITREYDALNRVTKYTDCNGNEIRYSYDSVGNLIALTYPGGKIVRYEYNASNMLVKVTDWANRVTSYEYDKNGRPVKTSRPNGTVMTTTYDAAGRMLRQKDVDAAGNIINQYDYTYDAVGNVTVEQSSNEPAVLKMNNAVMTYDKGNRLITYNGQTVEYDADGNMTYGPLNGQMVNFTYDSRNRLVKAGNTAYIYDAENNRTAVIENGVRTDYVNNPHAGLSQLLIKKDSQGNLTFYVYGIGLIGHEEADGTYRTYHFDIRGSTTAITDATGAVTDRFYYGPYGELVGRTGTTATPFLYNGRDGVMNDKNGLYYMRARYYNPDIKRFINQDIIQGNIIDGRSLNRYAYVNGNPVSLVDPFGLSPDFGPLSIVHGLLDLVSMVDPFGIADAVNAGIYAAEGDYVNMAVSAGCILVPAFLDAGAKAVKWGSSAFKTLRIGEKLAAGGAKIYDLGRSAVRNAVKGYDYVREAWRGSRAGRMLASEAGSVRAGLISGADGAAALKSLAVGAEEAGSGLKYFFDESVNRFRDAGTGRFVSTDTVGRSLATNPNEAFFWSGRTNGIGGYENAWKIAESHGGVTLEKLLNDRGIKMPVWDETNPVTAKIWENISSHYANQVSGSVRAIIGESLRSGAVWTDYELPRLLKNANVTDITIIDPATLAQRQIFKR